MEQIFVLRNIIEQSRTHGLQLLINFIDFKKAFGSVGEDAFQNNLGI